VVTTTTRSVRRPTGALYNPNRVRHRSTTTTTTTTTIKTPAASADFHQQRLQPGARLVRRRKYGSSSNQTRDSDATASNVQPSDSSNIPSTEKGKVRVKCSRYRPGVTQRVGRGIAVLFHDRGTRRGWVVSSTPRPHFTLGKDPVPILQEAGWASGPVWTGAENLVPTGIRSQTV